MQRNSLHGDMGTGRCQGRRKLIYIGPAAADQRVTPSKLLVWQPPDQPDLFLRPWVRINDGVISTAGARPL